MYLLARYLCICICICFCCWWYTPMCSRLILKSIRCSIFCLAPDRLRYPPPPLSTSPISLCPCSCLSVPRALGQCIALLGGHCARCNLPLSLSFSGLTRCMKCLNWCWTILPLDCCPLHSCALLREGVLMVLVLSITSRKTDTRWIHSRSAPKAKRNRVSDVEGAQKGLVRSAVGKSSFSKAKGFNWE